MEKSYEVFKEFFKGRLMILLYYFPVFKGRPLLVTEKKPRPESRRPRSPRSRARFNFNGGGGMHGPPAYHRPSPYYNGRPPMSSPYGPPQSRRYVPDARYAPPPPLPPPRGYQPRYDPYGGRRQASNPSPHDYYDPYMMAPRGALAPPPPQMYQHHHKMSSSHDRQSSSRYAPYQSSSSSYRR